MEQAKFQSGYIVVVKKTLKLGVCLSLNIIMRNNARAIVVKNDFLLVMLRNKYGERYYTLVGGGIEDGEDVNDAVIREVREESSLKIEPVKEVAFGYYAAGEKTTFIWCRYVSGEPMLDDSSEEAADNLKGENTYKPMWIKWDDLMSSEMPFYPDAPEIKGLIRILIEGGELPKEPVEVRFTN